ncbi:aldehyde dehydrogenase [Arcobacter sp. s6]|uniref:aldehyde dehydrogenase n=1 Tax=Arcobacter sp. s6 TaxID=3230363 RepID=UPI00349FE41E
MNEYLESRNPVNKKLIGKVLITNVEDINTIIEKSKIAQKKWKKIPIEERIQYLVKAAEQLIPEINRLAVLLSKEMGKDLNRSIGEVSGCAYDVSYRARDIKDAVKTQIFENSGMKTQMQYNPLGVCAVISPWNYPLAMAHWLIIPSLITGNSVVFKPSEETPLIAQEYVDLFNKVLPKDLLQIIHGNEKQGKALVNSDVNLIAFTGSKDAGIDIMKNASSGLKRLIMELGGKDSLIVLKDANIDGAARFAVASSFENAGQMCTSTERVFVHRSIADIFESKVIQYARNYKVGPWDEESDIGPIINDKQRNNILAQIEDACQKGAKIIFGEKQDKEGFILPTILTNVNNKMKVFQDETFGPIVSISYFDTNEEAIEKANDSEFGLGAVIYGKDGVEQVAQELEAGMLGINQGLGSAGDTPWVGSKQSGFGYHGSPDGHRQFTQVKIITQRA